MAALTYADYTASGSSTTFAIPFDRISDSHVYVYKNFVLQTTGYSVTGNNVIFTTAPEASTAIRVRRISDATERVVDYVDGARLSETDLDADSKQAFYLIQEGRDINEDSLIKNSDGNWEATGDRILNLGYPTTNNDAATKSYVDSTANNFANYGALNPFTRWAFTGNGTAVAFSITGATLLTEEAYLVHVNGTAIDPLSYTVTADTITFASAVVNGGKGVVVNLGYPKTDGIGAISTTFLADGAVTPAKLSTGGPSWTSGNNVSATTFTGALAGNATTATTATGVVDGAVSTTAKIANGVVTAAKLGTDEQKQICKAFASFAGSGTGAAAATINSSFNVSGIQRTATGVFTITFSNPMPSATSYAVVTGGNSFSTANNRAIAYKINPVNSTSFTLSCVDASTGATTIIQGADPICFSVFN